jgi:hypothetical protein
VAEAPIQRAILDAFQAMGVLAFRINSGKVKTRGGWYQGAPAGFPDVVVVVPPSGRLLGIEVKDGKGEERESQIRMRADLTRNGAVVVTVRSVEEALRAYLDVREVV